MKKQLLQFLLSNFSEAFSNTSRKTKTSKKMEFNIQDQMGLGHVKSPVTASAQKQRV
jgi:hypothetical protein